MVRALLKRVVPLTGTGARAGSFLSADHDIANLATRRELPSILRRSDLAKLPEGFFVRGVCMREAHGWTAIVLEFDIAGAGDVPTEAIADAIELVDDYLYTCFQEGLTFEQTLRPAPERFERLYRQSMEGSFRADGPRSKADDHLELGAATQAFRQPLPV